jgi:hypothetical protein
LLNNQVEGWSRQVVYETSKSVNIMIVPDLPNKSPIESLYEFGRASASRWTIPDIILVMSETKDSKYIAIHGASKYNDLACVELPITKIDGITRVDARNYKISNGIMNPESHGAAAVLSGINNRRSNWVIKI